MVLPYGSKLGFHSFYYNNSKYVTSEQIQHDLASVLDYVTNVGAPTNLIISMFNTNHTKIHWISRKTMSLLKIKRRVSGIRISSLVDTSQTKYDNSRSSKIDFIKNYFNKINYTLNKASLTNLSYNNRVALNSIHSTHYIYWLSKNLRYVKASNKFRIKSGNRVEARVYYLLKNGVRVCSKNTYKLKRTYNGWSIATKELSPCDSRSKKYLQNLAYRLP
jgi:hypothetical protein